MRAPLSPTVAVLAAALTWPVFAQGPRLHERLYRDSVAALRSGKLLVAARGLADPNFSHTVILLADHNQKGALGLVVNRRSEVTLAKVFPDLEPTLATAERAFLGGPVERTQALALVRGAEAPAGARRVADGVFLVASPEGLETLIASGASASRFRVYVGYAGWGPGQLEAETQEGSWHVVDATSDIVFAADPAGMWQRQIARTDVIQARRVDAVRLAAETP